MAADSDHVTYLQALSELHQDKLASALVTLENKIADYLATAPLKDGQLFDLDWAVGARRDLRQILDDEYLTQVDAIIRDYDRALLSSTEMLNTYGVYGQIEPSIINELKTLSFEQFKDISVEYLDVLSKQLYESTLVGSTFAESVTAVQSVAGGRLSRYSRQMVHDSLMQFDATVNVKLGNEAGATKWKYVGPIVDASRSHCKDHKGKTYTANEIKEIWKQDWDGKKEGDPFIVRGGYNCQHQFRPVIED